MDEQLKAKLKEWAGIYNVRSFIPDDPVQFPHRFTEKRDIEISAFITSWISQVPFAQQMSQLGCSIPICRSDLRAGGTIHANRSYLISFSFHLSFCIMILKQRRFNKPSTEIIGLSAFQNHLFSLIYIISEQGEIAQARIIREDMRQGLGYLKRRFQGGGSLLCQTKFQ
jgi:hypothetical protein